jgi:hypothetical protein
MSEAKLGEQEKTFLGKIFAAEIEGHLPFQSRAAIYKRLAEYGMVEFTTITLPGAFPVTITGWILTQYGRMRYCQSC